MVTGATSGLDGDGGQSPDRGDDGSDGSRTKLWAWAVAAAVVFAVLAGAYAIASSSDVGSGTATTQPNVTNQSSTTSTAKPELTTSAAPTTKPGTATTAAATLPPTTLPDEDTTKESTTTAKATTTTAAPTTTAATTTIPPNGVEIVPGLKFGVSSDVIRKQFQATLLNKRACDAMGLLTSIPAFSGTTVPVTPDLIKEYVSAWRTLATLVAASKTDGVSTASSEVRSIFGAAFDLIEKDGYAPSSLARLGQPINVGGRVVTGAELRVAVATKHQWELTHCPSELVL